ncbi:MAG: amino acid-binding ACT domain-containing protein [Chloroflexota bacterium]
MFDIAMKLPHTPGALADMGEALGKAGVSIEGGGAFAVDGMGIAHFLFVDGARAKEALERAGIEVIACKQVLVQKLRQDVPGQLGALTRRMAESGVNIEVLYSDHEHQLILVVDDYERGYLVSENWMAENARLP